MSKASIAIDIDDVLSNHVEAFVAFSNKEYGTDLSIDDYNERWPEIWKISKYQTELRAKKFHIPKNVAAYEVKQQAKAALQKLSEDFDLYIVTARSENLKDTTHEWIEKHFKGIFKEIHIVQIWFTDKKVTKAEVCKEIGAEYLIDDSVENCNIAANAGIDAILYGDYSWNENESLHDAVFRCSNWDQVLEYFKDRLK
jgi:5'(3')-deoxyribonucleotidase